jgi:hypothetical protein
MAAVGLRFRAELARRWLSWLGLALIIGLIGGAVLAMAAGARRTDSAYGRFLDAQDAFDVLVVKDTASFDGEGPPPGPPLDAATIRELPGVVEVAAATRFFTTIGSGVGVLIPTDGRLGDSMNRFKVLDGRAPDPENPTEVVVGFAFAEQYGVGVGDTIQLFDPSILDHVPPGLPPEVVAAALEAGDRILATLPGGQGTVVGIEAAPGEFPPQIEGTGRYLIHASPALAPVVDDLIGFQAGGDAVAVRLEHGTADVDAFLAALAAGDTPESDPRSAIVQRDFTTIAVRSVHTQADALRLLAFLTGVAGCLVGSQLLARITFVDSEDHPVLAALGMVRGERLVLGLARAATIATAAAVVAVVVAVGASPLFPNGLAATAEPTPGIRFDGLVLLGAVLLAVVVVLLAAWPSWLAARRAVATGPTDPGPGRPSLVGRALATVPTPLSLEVGVRMALEPGRGRAAVPVRSALTAVTLGIAAVAASLVFASSLGHLLSTPRLYGQTWDAELTTFDEALITEGLPALEADSRIAGIAVGRTRNSFMIGGARVDGLGIDPVKGELTPAVLEGRVPVSDEEIVIGTRTMHDLGIGVGDVIDVGGFAGDGTTVPMRVVGRAVFPVFSEVGQLGDGIYMTRDGGVRVDPRVIDLSQSVLVRLVPGADLGDVIDDVSALDVGTVAVIRQGQPTDIVNFGQVQQTPHVLGALLGAASAATLLQLLVTAPRRRRRDIAVLRSLGFVGGQVRAAVVWQALTTIGVALVLGVPLGIATGTTLWKRFADGLGVIVEPEVRPVAFALLVIGAVLGALVVAILPARSAARARSRLALRSE